MSDLPPIKRIERTGMYSVGVPMPSGRLRWIATGERTQLGAEAVVRSAGVDRLVHLVRARALTAEAIAVATTGNRSTCRDVLAAWEADVAPQLAAGTASTYRTWLTALFNSRKCWGEPLAGLQRGDLMTFLHAGKPKRATVVVRLSALRSLYGFAAARAFVVGNLSKTIRVNHRNMTFEQREPTKRKPFTADEYAVIQESAQIPAFWKAAVALGYWLGMRISDIASLEWASLRPEAVIVWTLKRDRRVELSLDNPLLGSGELRAVIGEMLIGPKADPVYCFPVQRAILLSKTPQRLSQDFSRIMDRGGLNRTHHCCRHAFCTRLAEAGVTMEEIGKLVGHTSTATTEGYVHREASA